METGGRIKVFDEPIKHADDRFSSGAWRAAGGNFQSLAFAWNIMDTVRKCPLLIKEITEVNSVQVHNDGSTTSIECRTFQVHDYGCAEGDGTAILKVWLPFADVIGIDRSPAAIKVASSRWPNVRFQTGNIENPTETADIIFSSHTIEHLRDPAGTINNLLRHCRWLVVGVPEIGGEDETHFGAVPTNIWIKQVPIPELLTKFTTARSSNPPDSSNYLIETTIVLLFKGRLHA